MEFKVRKGLETPLLIHGMLANYFYMHCVLTGVLALIIVVSGSKLISGSVSILAFGLILLFSVALYFGLKGYYTKKSEVNKLKFDKKKRCISNRDLLKSIK